MCIQTNRLFLREYRMEDFDALFPILSDPETMQYYPAPYDTEKVKQWIQWNLENYERHGFGLWAVVLKDTGEFIGDCGMTIQNIAGEALPEIGYHIHKHHWRNGYAKEASRAVRDWAFAHTAFDAIYCYMNCNNVASRSTAASIGMNKVREYTNARHTLTCVYAITRAEWEKLQSLSSPHR